MQYPYERFLRFLVSRKADHGGLLSRYGLPRVSDIWIAKTRSSIKKSAPPALAAYLDSKDAELGGRAGILDWAEGEGFRELWAMQPEFGSEDMPRPSASAFAIFVNPPRRKAIQLLLLTCQNHQEVMDAYGERFTAPITKETVDAYVRLFWDMNSMSRGAWPGFIESLTDDEEKHLVTSGIGHTSPDKAKGLIGLGTTLTEEQIVNKVVNMAYRKLEAAEEFDLSTGVIKWADLLLRTLKASREVIRPDTGPMVSGDFRGMFSVEVAPSKQPTLADLQAPTSIVKAKVKEGDQ